MLRSSVMSNSFATPWNVALQAPLSIGFSQQESWSRMPFAPPEDLPNPGIKFVSLTNCVLTGGFFTTVASSHIPMKYIFSCIFIPLSSLRQNRVILMLPTKYQQIQLQLEMKCESRVHSNLFLCQESRSHTEK